MKRILFSLALPCLFVPSSLHGAAFAGFTIDFVDIGDAGNAPDDTGYGAVGYDYRISKYEVSRGMIDAYNANSVGPELTLADMTSYGGNGPNRPATGLSWNEAARFVNWLNTSEGYSVAYKFTAGGYNDNIVLWTAGDAGYDPSNPFRNADANYFLPSQDEWYKAAYYDSDAATYFDYATGSDVAPLGVASGVATGTAVIDQHFNAGPADITNAGGLSPYGTMAQGGNVWELTESGYYNGANAPVDEDRRYRGGIWNNPSSYLRSDSSSGAISPTIETWSLGFRVAAVPEPSGLLLTLLGMMGVVLHRRR